MIQRLKRVEVENFRAYGGAPTAVDLDANVVLIHGRNGSGKTSLLAAIEYAVTGSVEHLSRFESDYPRVLRHHGAAGPAKVRLWGSTPTNDVFVERTAGERSPTDGKAFSRRAQVAFEERCYLSQTHLSQLLHVYQASSKASKGKPKEDAPVVRFIRDFLDLDHLEAVEKGLHVPADVRRLRNEFRDYADLETRVEKAESEARSARAEVDKTEGAERDVRDRLVAFASELALPSLDGVEVTAASAASEARSQATRFSEWVRVLSRDLRPGDDLPSPGPGINEAVVRRAFLHAARDIGEALGLLGEPNPSAGYAPPELSDDPSQGLAAVASEVDVWGQRLRNAQSAYEDTRQVSEKAIAQAAVEVAEIGQLLRRTAEVQRELAALEDLSTAAVEDVQQRQEALASIIAHVHDNVCPVCERDYGEKGGDLRDHIAAELERLGVTTIRLREQAEKRAGLVRESQRAERRVAELEAKAPADRAAAFRERLESIAAVPPLLSSARAALEQLADPIEGLRLQAQAHTARKEWRATHGDVMRAARGVLTAIDPDADPIPLTSDALTSVRLQAEERLQTLSARVTQLDRVVALAKVLKANATDAERARRRASETADDARRLSEAVERVNDLVTEAKRLRKAAADTTRSLIKRTFDDHLNDLVDDLYTRLVRDERFRPRITAKGQIGNLTAAVKAFAEGAEAADNIASLVSSANLNTAALSLFLALHLAEPSRPQVLVLDDPVQSMDDVHATNLAALFRSLAYHPQTPRQLVLAVHDRALFDYLALELGPTKEGDALIEVEVIREAPNKVAVRDTRRTWTPDQVRFGKAS